MAVHLISISEPIERGRFFVACLLLASVLLPAYGTAQCSLSCNPGIQVSLNVSGQVTITPQMIAPNAASSCPGALEVKLYGPLGNLLPNPLTCANIGQDITATVRHIQSGNNCSGSLSVQDALPPSVSCPDKFVWCNQDPSPYETGFPVASDNCTASGNLSSLWFDDEINFSCGVYQNGVPVAKRIDRTWITEDASGNQNTCLQHIWLKHITIQNLSFPANLDNFVLPALSCGQDPADLNLTGQPAVDSLPVDISTLCEMGVTFTDQSLNVCPPAGYTVIRTWTAVDFCSSAVTNRIQIIKVEDHVPPVIAPPANITVGTTGFLCKASVQLPQALGSDNCSTVNINPVWDFGSGYGPFNNVPVGGHTVLYTATDACGNTSTATMSVTVVDNSPPQAICPASIQVSLSTGGTAFLGASTLDGGSSDNCGPVTLTISRDGENYFPSLQLNCADQAAAVPVTLKVTDQVGLENLCTTDVLVRDFLKPLLQCPANTTLTCLQNYSNLLLTGQATGSDNCTLQNIDFTDITNIAPCNIGTVTRIWKATDAAGNTKTCNQQIAVNPISTVAIVFPADITLNDCIGPSASLPAVTGSPTITGQYCSPLSVTFTDQVFSGIPPSCFRLLRTWKVFDWCVYNPNGGTAGSWEHTQVIDIQDHTAPDLSVPFDITLDAGAADCGALVSVSDAVATDCSGTISLGHNSAFAQASGANASGTYPVGVHTVVFTATDVCGNAQQRSFTITVRDQTPPLAVCQNTVPIQIQANGLVILSPVLLNAGSSDNCSPAGSLVFSTAEDTFSCLQIGNQQVVLHVTDLAGNGATCNSLIQVLDPLHICNGDISHTIEGNVRTESGDTVRSIPMLLVADGFLEWRDCDTTGYFYFDDVPAGNLYHLKPYNNAKWLNGLSTFDLVLISKHILGLQPLSSPWKIIAADANRSGSVTTTDILQLRKLILGISDSLTGNTSWRFLPAGFTFINPSNPFTAPFPEERLYPNLDSNYTAQDFVGLKVGDVNNTTNPANVRSPGDSMPIYIGMDKSAWAEDSIVRLPVYLSGWTQLDGFQFELAFDPEMATIKRIEYAVPDLLNDTHVSLSRNNTLAVSWNRTTTGENRAGQSSLLFSIFISVKQKADLFQAIRLAPERIAPEVYRDENEPLLGLTLQFDTIAKQAPGIRIFDSRPNPFTNKTIIPFHLGTAGEVGLTISDMLGRVVERGNKRFGDGDQEWEIEGNGLPGAGIYRYRLFLPDGAGQTGTLILLE